MDWLSYIAQLVFFTLVSRCIRLSYRFLNQLIVQHRDTIVPLARQLQRILGIPAHLRVIHDEGPGISDVGLRLVVTLLVCLPMLSLGNALFYASATGSFWSWQVIATAVVAPICLGIWFWAVLLVVR
ncbi:hypothetical protein F4805DRAFT_460030 [Annulohypoxylon moriforme]|nr:hypothetical protein F4805DRAFT_460030 [Annulohypoxylon moriforme]